MTRRNIGRQRAKLNLRNRAAVPGALDYSKLAPKPEDTPTLPFGVANNNSVQRPRCANTGVPAEFCTCAGPH